MTDTTYAKPFNWSTATPDDRDFVRMRNRELVKRRHAAHSVTVVDQVREQEDRPRWPTFQCPHCGDTHRVDSPCP